MLTRAALLELRQNQDALLADPDSYTGWVPLGELAEVGRLEIDAEAQLEILTPGRRSTE